MNYYVTLFGNIAGDFEDSILINSISSDSLGVGNHAFIFGTGDTTFKIKKELEENFDEDGYELQDEVKFKITITAEGDTASTQPLYIEDVLSGSNVLVWNGEEVSDVVSVVDDTNGSNAACALDDNQEPIEDGKLLIKLKE